MDIKAIADALALRYASTNVTPPAGYTKNIQTSTAQPPNNIPSTPYVIVWTTEGEVTLTSSTASHVMTWPVTFYYAKSEGDTVRQYAALQSWVGVLLGQTYGALKLGLASAGVMKAIPIRWEIGTVTYAGDVYEAITITVTTWADESVSLVS